MTADRHHHTHLTVPAGRPAASDPPGPSTTALARRLRRHILDALQAASVTSAIDQTFSLPMNASLAIVSEPVWHSVCHHTTRRISP